MTTMDDSRSREDDFTGDGSSCSMMLSDELLIAVLCWVPPIDLLQSTCLVSKRFASCLMMMRSNNDGEEEEENADDDVFRFWRCHPLLPQTIASELTKNRRRYTVHQLQRCCLYAAAVADVESDSNSEVPSCLEFGSCLLSKEEGITMRRSRPDLRVCVASTTDHASECVENLLPPNQRWEFMPRFRTIRWWSSRPTEHQDTDDVLVFTTKYPETLISEVCIKPLKDPYHGRIGCTYTWKNTIIRAYRLPVGGDALLDSGPPCAIRAASIEGAAAGAPSMAILDFLRGNTLAGIVPAPSSRATIDALLDGQSPVYESPVLNLPKEGSNEWVKFTLPLGVVANVVAITLQGKHNRQFDSSGFYCCAERVQILGLPLYSSPRRNGGGAHEHE